MPFCGVLSPVEATAAARHGYPMYALHACSVLLLAKAHAAGVLQAELLHGMTSLVRHTTFDKYLQPL